MSNGQEDAPAIFIFYVAMILVIAVINLILDYF